MLKATYFHNLDEAKKISVALEMIKCLSTSENNFLIGGSWLINHLTFVKVKVNNHGNLNALLQRSIIYDKVFFEIYSDFNIKGLYNFLKFVIGTLR